MANRYKPEALEVVNFEAKRRVGGLGIIDKIHSRTHSAKFLDEHVARDDGHDVYDEQSPV